ncbi:hypothetical protein ACH34W_27285 [Actinomadura sp. 6N118]
MVFDHGTETSAKAAFGYRLGMTMAQWACCGLMGLGQTTHVEAPGLVGLPFLGGMTGPRPDLVGRHSADSLPWWLVEAKGGVGVGLPVLRKGQEQLEGGSLAMNGYPHRLILCGTSLNDHVFMTIDEVQPPGSGQLPRPDGGDGGPDDSLDEDPDALLSVAKAQLLTYLNLRYSVRDQVQLVALVERGARRSRPRTGMLTPLENDQATSEVRQRLRSREARTSREVREQGAADFLVGPIAGTDVRLGLTRRLFAACEQLFQERIRYLPDVPVGRFLKLEKRSGSEEEVLEELAVVERIRDAAEAEDRSRIRDSVFRAYRTATERDWPQLLERAEPPLDLAETRLEGATAETYISIPSNDPLLQAAT